MDDEITLDDVAPSGPDNVGDAALAAVDAIKTDAVAAPYGAAQAGADLAAVVTGANGAPAADPLAKPADPANPANPAAAQAKPVEAKKPDGKLTPEDLEKPSYLREKAAERFTRLTEGYKVLDKENTELKAQIDGINQGLDLFRELGFGDEQSAQDLIQFSTYRTAINSGNFEQAKEILIGQLHQLQMATGQPIDSGAIDPLAAFPDLAQRVQAFDLDRETALELARARAGQQQARQVQQRQQDTQAQAQQESQAVEKASATVAQMARQWSSANPDFKRIAPQLMEQAKAIEEKFPPHMWADQIAIVYGALNSALQQFGSTQRETFQPLRATGQAGGKPAPTNIAEAALQAVGMLGS